jgi:hypothetical protein
MAVAKPRELAERSWEQSERVVRDFFEPQLRALGLTIDQIKEQNLEQLEISLNSINEAIANPDSFGKIRLLYTATAGAIIAQSQSEAHVERGILPILLERKAFILDRIKELRSEERLSNLRDDVANNVEDPVVREQVVGAVDHYLDQQRAESERIEQQKKEVEAKRMDALEREQRLNMEMRERKWAIYRSFIERESMASIIGSILLILLAVVLIIGMFSHTAPSDVVSNAFLLVLGYFFAQATTRSASDRESKDKKQ